MGGLVTYEELFELLRLERSSEEAQILDENFYSKLINYFQEKQRVLDDKSDEANMFGASERDNVKTQLDNAKKIAKELTERREKKILMLALNKVRTGSDIIDTSALLDVEKEFFHKAVDLLAAYNAGVIENMFSSKLPVFGTVQSKPFVDVEEKAEAEAEEKHAPRESSIPTENEMKFTGKSSADPDPELVAESIGKLVRFISPVPKFLGKDEQTYGPYQEAETATLAEEIANILISKGRAVEIEK